MPTTYTDLLADIRKSIDVVSLDEIKQRLEAKTPMVLIDVREKDEFLAGYIPGAVSVPSPQPPQQAPAATPVELTGALCEQHADLPRREERIRDRLSGRQRLRRYQAAVDARSEDVSTGNLGGIERGEARQRGVILRGQHPDCDMGLVELHLRLPSLVAHRTNQSSPV